MRMLLAVFALFAFSGIALADHHEGSTITVESPWARASASMAGAGAAYFLLSTSADTPDLLVAGSTPVSDRVELHTHLMEDGIMRMREIEAIEVAPGTPTVLEPGGLHVMLIGLREPLVEGETFPLTLDFETAGEVTVEVVVRAITATEHGGDDAHGAHGSMN